MFIQDGKHLEQQAYMQNKFLMLAAEVIVVTSGDVAMWAMTAVISLGDQRTGPPIQEQRSGGIEEQRDRGIEEKRKRGKEEQRNRGIEENAMYKNSNWNFNTTKKNILSLRLEYFCFYICFCSSKQITLKLCTAV